MGVVVKEILDFKEVADDRRVPLVATKFKERATVWWQQMEQGTARESKDQQLGEIVEAHESGVLTP
jgi:hypothetical protein